MFVGDASFEGNTLIIPGVSHGNVGQLAVDLIIATRLARESDVVRVGQLLSSHVTATAGNDVFSDKTSGRITTNLEVHQIAAVKTTLLQLRSPIVSGHEEAFAVELAKWVKEAGFVRVVIVAGADAALRGDGQLEGPQLRVIGNSTETASDDALVDKFNMLGISTLERLSADHVLPAQRPAADSMGDAIEPVPGPPLDPEFPKAIYDDVRTAFLGVSGTGYTQRFVRRLQAADVPAVALLMFVNEGDNRRDGVIAASGIEGVLHPCFGSGTGDGAGAGAGAGADSSATAAAPLEWTPPSSWEATFGSPLDVTLYG